jgi:hypothetical protein
LAILAYCGCCCFPLTMNRTDTRTKYNIAGNGVGDCFTATCCTCCALIQEEKEIIYRSTVAGNEGYLKQNTMEYQPPQVDLSKAEQMAETAKTQ